MALCPSVRLSVYLSVKSPYCIETIHVRRVTDTCSTLSAGASVDTDCVSCIHLCSSHRSRMFPARLHTDGESLWRSRSTLCGTWRSGRAENSKGTRQTSFSVAAPVIWNSRPKRLRSFSISKGQFRRGLKTQLFEPAYNLREHCVEECVQLN